MTFAINVNDLRAGCSLSFSAGGNSTDLSGYRVIGSEPDRLADLLTAVPSLRSLVEGRSPTVVSAYPAALLQSVPGAIFVDTHMRQATFDRGLLLAARRGSAAIILSQPLILLDLLLAWEPCKAQPPAKVVLILGGYWCPEGAEALMRDILNRKGVEVAVVHGYGMAETGVGCLLGLDRTETGDVCYRVVAAGFEALQQDGLLGLRALHGPNAGRLFMTGDQAKALPNGGWVIRNPPSRLDPAVRRILTSWPTNYWRRLTGRVAWGGEAWASQLRIGSSERHAHEVEFFNYAREFGLDLHDKPRWHRR